MSKSQPQNSFDALGASMAGTIDLLVRVLFDTGRVLFGRGDRHRMQELFGAVRLSFKTPTGAVNYPRLVEVQKRTWGRRLVYDLHPCPGLTYEDFAKFTEEIEYTLHSKVDMHPKHSRYVLIDVYARQVPSRIVCKPSLFRREGSHYLSAPVGVSAAGVEVIDLAGHLSSMLVGGIRGSGKSKLLRFMLVNTVLQYEPSEVNLWLVDMKNGLEFELYRGVPHVRAIAGDHNSAKKLLARYVKEMERRGEELRKAGATSWQEWDAKAPQQLLVVDEFAELDDTAKEQVAKIARLGRAAGMNVIVCTQYPTKEVLPQQVKQNLHHTVAFRVRNKTASQVILDQGETQASALEPVPGRAIYQGLRTREIQVPYLSQAEAKKLLADIVQNGPQKEVEP